MAMTIDEAIKRYKNNAEYERTHGNLQGCLEFRQLAKWLEQYQLIQADYNARLKADMVAMLEDLRLDCQEAELAGVLDNKELIFADEVDDIIQQRINSLKAESEDT